jgi:hypothetical protein
MKRNRILFLLSIILLLIPTITGIIYASKKENDEKIRKQNEYIAGICFLSTVILLLLLYIVYYRMKMLSVVSETSANNDVRIVPPYANVQTLMRENVQHDNARVNSQKFNNDFLNLLKLGHTNRHR